MDALPENVSAPAAPLTPAQAWKARRLDLPSLVAAHDPRAPKPWVVEPFAIKGTLAVLAGKGGVGKTWVMHEAAAAVAEGTYRAGLRGAAAGRAVIFDAEMGQWLTVDRFASQQYPTSIEVVNAQGLDLRTEEGRAIVWAALDELQPAFVGFDSLKALTPSGKENESDDMGPVVNWIRAALDQLESKPAGLLLHHAGWKEDRTRGSSAIKDRVDAVWYLNSPEDDGTQKLSCRGADLKAPRWCRPPDDLFVRLREEGGLELADAPPSREERESSRDEEIVALIKDSRGLSGRVVAEQLGIDKNRCSARLKFLANAGRIEREGSGAATRWHYLDPSSAVDAPGF